MKKGLFSKMMITYTIIIGGSFVVIAAFLSSWFEGYYFNQRKSQLLSESQFIKSASAQYLSGSMSQQELTDVISYIAQLSSSDIWLVDNYGFVYAVSSNKNKNLISNQILVKELNELRLNHFVEKKSTLGLYNFPVYSLQIPIFSGGVFKGAIITNTSMLQLKGPLKKVYSIIWYSALSAILASCFVLYYFSQRIIIKPLKQINYAANKISKGEVDKRVSITSNDEIGELGKAFNSMADSIEQIERNRREFISNVSHEIRSPITSIKGFVGGILDGVIPKEKENYYLSVVYDETQRLTRLVNDLLDLSAIESGQLKMKNEKIDINEIIRIAVIKFEQKIKLKNLSVDVCLQEDNLYVIGDKDRVVQIVTNLLDNAVKYVNEGGEIKVCSKIKGQKAYISFFDSGPNIPEGDLRHIWDRFYRGDKSRSVKTSTGLGLSIVRSILTELGEDIWAENKDSVGVLFTFTLKATKI